MAPVTQTLYSVNLFLALVALKLWCDRRHGVRPVFRACAARMLKSGR